MADVVHRATSWRITSPPNNRDSGDPHDRHPASCNDANAAMIRKAGGDDRPPLEPELEQVAVDEQ